VTKNNAAYTITGGACKVCLPGFEENSPNTTKPFCVCTTATTHDAGYTVLGNTAGVAPCKACKSNVCEQCNEGFTLSALGYCVCNAWAIPNCAQCAYAICTECYEGYYLKETANAASTCVL